MFILNLSVAEHLLVAGSAWSKTHCGHVFNLVSPLCFTGFFAKVA
jgi:hypothetical protein